jgi:phage terminase large subunit GpA-like protein
VGKWEKMDYNPVHMLYGRQEAYPNELRRSIIESSPYDVGDYFYQEIFRPGTLILRPHYPCPICGEFQVLTDSQIKLRKTGVEDPTHEAARIRAEKEAAVFYECLHCRQEIREKDRVEIDSRVIWAAPEITEGDFFKQDAEKISKAGEITGPSRKKFDMVCFGWNRFVDLTFTFYECLARFQDSVHNPEKFKVYETETMARFWRKKHERINISRFESYKGNYFKDGINNRIPNETLTSTIGIDSQDKFSILRYGKIYWPLNTPEYLDKNKMVETVIRGIFNGEKLIRKDGAIIESRLGFIDRGGHRDNDVDYLVSKISFLQAYIGLTRTDPKKELVYKSDNGPFWLGQSEAISEYVGMLIEKGNIKIPKDSDNEFLKQLASHYHTEKTDPYGNTKSIWVKLKDQDHYRSCLEYAYAAAKVLKADTALFDENILRELNKQIEQTRPGAALPKEEAEKPQGRNQNRYGNNEYYSRALR